MASEQKGWKATAWLVGFVGLLAVGGGMTALALAAPEYAVPAGGVLGLAVVGGTWRGLRARSHNRLRAALDAFADRELARQQ